MKDKKVFKEFVNRSESLVTPENVSIFSMATGMFTKISVEAQRKLMRKSTSARNYMGFVVEPYSFFLCHEITDMEKAAAMLPEKYKIVPCSIFEHDEPKNYIIFAIFNSHTSAFWGSRLEMYVVAENLETSLLSWVIVDYDTNTNSFDPGEGFISSTTAKSIVTTTHEGNVLIDMQNKYDGKRIALEADIKDAPMHPLSQRIWVEASLSIAYGGKKYAEDSEAFSLIFDPDEMREAIHIPLDKLSIEELSWYPGLYDPNPSQVACFPYSQHFMTTSKPVKTDIKNAQGLIEEIHNINPTKLEGMSIKGIKRAISASTIVPLIISVGLLIALIVK